MAWRARPRLGVRSHDYWREDMKSLLVLMNEESCCDERLNVNRNERSQCNLIEMAKHSQQI